MKKVSLFRLNSCNRALTLLLCVRVIKICANIEQSFLMHECSYKIIVTISCDTIKTAALLPPSLFNPPKWFFALFYAFCNHCRVRVTAAFTAEIVFVWPLLTSLFYHMSRRSRSQVTLRKPLLRLNGILSIKNHCSFTSTWNTVLSIVSKITKITLRE